MEQKTFTANPREFDHTLAALRTLQRLIEVNSGLCRRVEEIATEHGEWLTAEEIDQLCEHLNCSDKLPPHPSADPLYSIFASLEGIRIQIFSDRIERSLYNFQTGEFEPEIGHNSIPIPSHPLRPNEGRIGTVRMILDGLNDHDTTLLCAAINDVVKENTCKS